ncbi:hypothetical protein H7J87_27455 [Mycolicibacterium wolinskyi]|uniref:hypothetical protein n=1 Tax=Mycolicibacterium TaxID=1866885 RepID=UPI001055A9B9|nr:MULTISPECIES: hypothetical protein [Mycolicibacterium]MCV7289070.1 hypothetical protein [Mycolicibacterium wolinskyi]MCV7296497.1 hypothetical protein [Mycolicibacterium goodii]
MSRSAVATRRHRDRVKRGCPICDGLVVPTWGAGAEPRVPALGADPAADDIVAAIRARSGP